MIKKCAFIGIVALLTASCAPTGILGRNGKIRMKRVESSDVIVKLELEKAADNWDDFTESAKDAAPYVLDELNNPEVGSIVSPDHSKFIINEHQSWSKPSVMVKENTSRSKKPIFSQAQTKRIMRRDTPKEERKSDIDWEIVLIVIGCVLLVILLFLGLAFYPMAITALIAIFETVKIILVIIGIVMLIIGIVWFFNEVFS